MQWFGFTSGGVCQAGPDEKVDHRVGDTIVFWDSIVKGDCVATCAACITGALQTIAKRVGKQIGPLLDLSKRPATARGDVAPLFKG